MYKKRKINLLKEKKIIYINWRFFILYSFIFLSLVTLTLRIIFLQIINPDKLIEEGDRRTLRIQSLMNTRGIITDRSGHPLAVTVLANAVCANPSIIDISNKIKNNLRWKELSNILNIPLKEIIFQINHHKKSKFIYLARQINTNSGRNIKKLKLPGIFLLEESKRYYPYREITSQLIGFTNVDGVGIEGVEKSFNALLMGKPGKRKIRQDKKGQIIENTSLITKSASSNLTLSIDNKLQRIVYHELHQSVKKNKADSGIAVLLDIKTGEILSMANSPAYNPNNMQYIAQKNIRNRAITDMFEPGSTVKPIVVMEGLKLGIIKKNSTIKTEPYLIKNHQIKDVSHHKKLTITGILQKSSNVGISKIALSMPLSKLINSYLKFGLGKPTDTGLIGEKSGFLNKKKMV